MFISWMLIMPSFQKSLIVQQFQGNYLKIHNSNRQMLIFTKTTESVRCSDCWLQLINDLDLHSKQKKKKKKQTELNLNFP